MALAVLNAGKSSFYCFCQKPNSGQVSSSFALPLVINVDFRLMLLLSSKSFLIQGFKHVLYNLIEYQHVL